MSPKTINNLLKKRILVLDGATGTELQKRGLPQGACPEIWGLENPSLISALHADYKKSGADIIYSSTFGANRIKLGQYGNYNVGKTNERLCRLAKAVAGKTLVAGDIGPTGRFVEPFGSLGFEDAVNVFKEQIKGLLSGGVDLFVIETMMDIQEARAALIAAKETADKFTIVTMTFEENGRTLNGTDPLTALITLQSLGADAFGCNCSSGPEQMLKLIETLKPYAKIPLVAKPNAGMPKLKKGLTFFDMEAEEFASFADKFASKGVNMLGGCCGTTPEHTRHLKARLSGISPIRPLRQSVSALSSAAKNIIIGRNEPLAIVGECINPTGKKALQKELREDKTSLIRSLAREQRDCGAGLLDVNIGISGIDEKKVFKKIINLLVINNDLPLVIDSSKPEVIESALRLYPGRALVNSISGERTKIKKLLFLAAKYGAMFILLPLDEKGIPKDFKKRKAIIERIFKEAKNFDFTKDDIVVDGLVMTISSDSYSAKETLKTIFWCSRVFKSNTIIGLSNISFGMPKRSWINAAFLAMAQAQGLSMVIANPLSEEVTHIKRAAGLLLQKDKNITEFLKDFGQISFAARDIPQGLAVEQKIFKAILEGNKEDIKSFIREALKEKAEPYGLVNNTMIPAIDKVGELFEKKEYFLPQLISSAETIKIAFQFLEPYLKKFGINKIEKTAVLLATVKGDIHDIGKNIVGLMLKNHGFLVVDLGKDVSAKKIIQEIKKHKQPIVGLSALMTTTMINMKEVVDRAKIEGLNCRFIVGGAVLNKSYASFLGAEYAKDAVQAVRVVKSLSET